MFKILMRWLTKLFDSWTKPWDSTQDLEFKEWAYRHGLHIKTDLKD